MKSLHQPHKSLVSKGYKPLIFPLLLTFLILNVSKGLAQSCSSRGSVNNSEYISRVQIGTLDNSSGRGAEGYQFFSLSRSGSVNANSTVDITITPTWTDGRIYQEAYVVWVDFNQNGDFSDAGEKVVEIPPTSDEVVNASFYVPDVSVGVRSMRIAMKRGALPTNCEEFDFGEVEDHYIQIQKTCGSRGGTFGEYISRVQIGDFINNSTKSSSNFGYENFKNKIIELSAGEAEDIDITPTWDDSEGVFNEGYSIAVDLNRDNDFDDENEIIAEISPTQDSPVTTSFTVPSNRGTFVMRISMERGGIPETCPGFGGIAEGEVEDYTLKISGPTEFSAFNLEEQVGKTAINYSNFTVKAEVELGTDLSQLVPSFSLSQGANAKIGTETQISGFTTVDFSNPVIYDIASSDGSTTQNWTVTVTERAPSTETNIRAFYIEEQSALASINRENHTISIRVPFDVNLNGLVPIFTLSNGATATINSVVQESGIDNVDFTSSVIYLVTAEDGTTSQQWAVSIEKDAPPVFEFLTFSVPNQVLSSTINSEQRTVTNQVPFKADRSALIADFTLTNGAEARVGSIVQTSGITSNDFSNPVTYILTDPDQTVTYEWTVTITEAEPRTGTDFIIFSIPGQAQPAEISLNEHTITLLVPFNSDVSSATPTFSVSEGAVVQANSATQTSGISTIDLSQPVTYTVIAEDGIRQEWLVTVNEVPANTGTDFLQYSFDDQVGSTQIDPENHTINIFVLSDTDRSALIADFQLSPGASVQINGLEQISGVTINDFNQPLTYVITAQDGVTVQEWIVTVTPRVQVRVNAISKTTGPVGTSVEISGSNFDPIPANNVVYFGATEGLVETSSETELMVTVPHGATNRAVSVTRNGLIALLNESFNTTYGGTQITNESFADATSFGTDSEPREIRSADLNRDGLADLVVANNGSNSFSVHRNTSSSPNDISFAQKMSYQSGTGVIAIELADIDGDGFQDVIVVNQNVKSISVFRNSSSDGSITFESQNNFTTGNWPHAITSADLDGDGKLDLITVNSLANTISVLRNNSAGPGSVSFETKIDYPTDEFPIFLKATDLNGDGRPEIITSNINGNTISIFSNKSDTPESIVLDPKIDIATGSGPWGISVGDLNMDGIMDLAVANVNSSTVSIFKNESTGQTLEFAEKIDFNTGTSPRGIDLGDLDGDGKLDMATANESGSVSVLSNRSNSSDEIIFSPNLNFNTGRSSQSVAIGDLDNDSKPELAVVNRLSNSISVLRNINGPARTDTEILSFSLMEESSMASIDPISHTITIEVPYGTNVASLIPIFTLSYNARAVVNGADQISDVTENDFSNPVTYSIIAEDGITAQDWTVIVTIAPNTEADILSFSLPEQTGNATINPVNQTVDVEVEYGTDITSLTPTISISEGAIISPASQITQNFEAPVTYSVTAEDQMTTREWVVTVSIAKNTETDILAFSFSAQTSNAIIDPISHTVQVEVDFGTNLTSLAPTIALSDGATVEPGNQVPQNFTNPVDYLVTAEDGQTSQNWIITVETAPNDETDILTFVFAEQVEDATIDPTTHTINVRVKFGSNITSLMPSITLSPEATISPAGGVSRDFTNTVTYTITAENEIDIQDWSINVTVAPILKLHNNHRPISIYPIPVKEELFIELGSLDDQTATISLTSITGQEFQKFTTHGKSLITMDVGSFPGGLYLVLVETNESYQVFRLIKK